MLSRRKVLTARPLMQQVTAAADESPASGGKKPRKKKDKNAPKNVRGRSQKLL